MRPSLTLAMTSLPQASFMLESRSTQMPILPFVAAAFMSISNARALADVLFMKDMPPSCASSSLVVCTVS